MPEVIDLLSSPDLAKSPKKTTTAKSGLRKSAFDDDDDVIWSTDNFTSSKPTVKPNIKPKELSARGRTETSSISRTRLPDSPRIGSKRTSVSPTPLDASENPPKKSKSSYHTPIVLDSDDDVPHILSTSTKMSTAENRNVGNTEATVPPITTATSTAMRKGLFDSDDLDIEKFLSQYAHTTTKDSKAATVPSSPAKAPYSPAKPRPKAPLSPKVINIEDTTPVRKDRTRELLDRLLADDGEGDLYDDLEMPSPTTTPKRRKLAQSRKSQTVDAQSPSAIATKRSTARKGKPTEEEKEEREAQKAAEKAAKEVEKTRLGNLKKAEREAAASQKAFNAKLREANKIRTLAQTLPEMIIDLCQPFDETPAGIILVRDYLPEQPCSFKIQPPPITLPAGHLITFRRKLTARYDEATDMFLPAPERIVSERHLICHLSALDFLDMALHDAPTALDAHFQSIASLYDGKAIPIYIIEGLSGLVKKANAKKQRAFKDTVRSIGPTTDAARPRRRKPANAEKERLENMLDELDAEVAEQCLLKLQMLVTSSTPTSRPRFPLIHQTATPVESADWILVFAKEISRSYYKVVQGQSYNQHAVERGPAKCGNNPKDTFYKMLQEITRVTPGVASGIMGEFGSVRELWLGCKESGEQVVEDVRTESARNGAAMAGKRIGIQGSRRVWRVFTSLDEHEENI